MKEYDVFIAGGAVAGPVAAKFCAKQRLKTLLIEKANVPREKPCSGIQFPYFEKIIGESIPRDRLCHNVLNKTELHFPNGKSTTIKFPMINFMRDTFDEWLCILAQENGAEFRDGCEYKSFEETPDGIIIHLETENGQEKVKAKYVIDATGMRPIIRRQLRKEDGFEKGSSGASLNYYFSVESGNLEPNKLYQFWNIDFNNMMFAWIYNKTLNDGKDYWVVGTGYDKGINERLDHFVEYIKQLYCLEGMKIVKKEGYSSSMLFNDKDRIWLGEKNFLMAGDAAGLIDITRGVGMDAAALSGRIAANAIGEAERTGAPVAEIYAKRMKRLVNQTRKNQQSSVLAFQTNEELQGHLDRSSIPMGVNMLLQKFLNRFRSAEHQVMLP